MSDFEGLTALVTGGTSGIGAATAQLLHERGGRVAVLGRAPTGSSGHLEFAADVTDLKAIRHAVAEVVGAFGGIDILVNSAGVSAVGDVTANDEAEWRDVLDVNVVGIVRMSAEALPYIQQSAGGAIVNIGSIAATVGVRQRALYSASKGAVSALTRAMAADHLRDGIRVNAVLPGTTDTPWVARLLERSDDPEAAAAELRARQPIGRLVTAEEVAHAVAYLASPLSGSTTGTHCANGVAGTGAPPKDSRPRAASYRRLGPVPSARTVPLLPPTAHRASAWPVSHAFSTTGTGVPSRLCVTLCHDRTLSSQVGLVPWSFAPIRGTTPT